MPFMISIASQTPKHNPAVNDGHNSEEVSSSLSIMDHVEKAISLGSSALKSYFVRACFVLFHVAAV